ncbi:MAG: type II secretion system protein [bacterium]
MINQKSGFTLIELLIVMVIIVILAGGGFALYVTSTNKAYDTNHISAVKDGLEPGLAQYYSDNDSTYPDAATAEALKTILTDTTDGKTAYVKSTLDVDGITYTHLTDPSEGYTLEFTLKNQNLNDANVTGTAPNKTYTITSQD